MSVRSVRVRGWWVMVPVGICAPANMPRTGRGRWWVLVAEPCPSCVLLRSQLTELQRELAQIHLGEVWVKKAKDARQVATERLVFKHLEEHNQLVVQEFERRGMKRGNP